jgi:drug/metabolite transporter (DMT)-like permease
LDKKRAWLFLLLANLFWAGNYVFGKYVTAELSPVWITFSRWLIAICLLFPLAHLLEKPDWRKVMRRWLPLSALGLLGVVSYNISLYAALQYTSSTNAALVNSLNPACIVLFSALLLKETISKLQIGGFILSLFGVFVILTKGEIIKLFSMEYNIGDLLMIVAILAWTFYSIIAKKLTGLPTIAATAASSLLGTLILLPFAIPTWEEIGNIGLLSITGILYMAFFPSVGSYLLWNISVRNIGASKAGITLNFIPVFTALIGLALGETITSAQLWGGLLVCTGVYLSSGAAERRKISETEPRSSRSA